MLTISPNANQNYLAKIVTITEVQPVPNADRLVMSTIDGNIVVMNKENLQIPATFVYFPVECSIEPWFLTSNNLYAEKEKNVDPEKKGFFDKHGRVKCVNLRGTISSGFVMPIETLTKKSVKVGTEFDTIEGVLLVSKYVPVVRNTEITNYVPKQKESIPSRVIEGQFNHHISTPQLGRSIESLSLTDNIEITRKYHGTSGISAYVLCNPIKSKAMKIREWVDSKIIIPILDFFKYDEVSRYNVTKVYDYLYSSRTVIKNARTKPEEQGNDVWAHADLVVRPFLIPGMAAYYEIVGYQPSGSSIQKGYNYGCIQPSDGAYTHGIHYQVIVYRVTMTTPGNVVYELPPVLMQSIFKDSEIQTPYIYYTGSVSDYMHARCKDEDFGITSGTWRDKFLAILSENCLEKIAKDCGPKIPDEGIVIRKIDNVNKFDVFKYKSKLFLYGETKELDKGEINIEY